MNERAISITDLKKVYSNGTVALSGVDLEIPRGDFFALLGPNGAGKTTLISIVSGLTNKTDGKVEVFGKNIDRDPEKAKSYIGVVPQEFNFGIFEKVEDIVFDQAGYYGLSRTVVASSVEKYLRTLGLYDKRKDQSRTLSGGMKRRLMIARALVHEPKILILDEPTAGVDIELRRGMWDFLRGLTSEGRTIVLTTHYLEEAEQLARNIAIINNGVIAEKGTLKELLLKLHMETFVLDLERNLSEGDLVALKSFNPVKTEQNTLEVSLSKEQNLSQAIIALNQRGIEVKSMRNKSNRLEELFLGITKK
jgi:ABC-2 type transport system ATP-binding protein